MSSLLVPAGFKVPARTDDDVWTVDQVAEYLKMSAKHVRRIVPPGRFTCGRNVRWRADAVREWVALGCPH